METNIEVLRGLEELVEAARLLGTTQAKKGFGCYTEEDSRFERAMHESIAKHRAALAAMGGQGEDASLRAALEAILPYAQHADSCGDMDAYNNVAMPRCDCGLDLAKSAAYDALAAPHQPDARVGGDRPGPDWRFLYEGRREVISRWHARAVSLGYEGVEDLLSLALPCIVNNAGEERPTPPPSSVPVGWKLVPVEPTEAMQFPSYMGPDGPKWPMRKSIYRAMLAAAPEPKGGLHD